MLVAGPFFTVQVKSDARPILYEKKYEIDWIAGRENPFFIAVADRENLKLGIYSTWRLQHALEKISAPHPIKLTPGLELKNEYFRVKKRRGQSVTEIPLGKSILTIKATKVTHKTTAAKFGKILKEWAALDRENIVRNSAGMFLGGGEGPKTHETNKRLGSLAHSSVSFYWNPANLPPTEVNFGYAATSLRLELANLVRQGKTTAEILKRGSALDEILKMFRDSLPEVYAGG